MPILLAFYFIVGCFASVSDIRTGFISRPLLLFAIAVAIACQLILNKATAFRYIVGCAVGLAIFYLVRMVTRRQLGMADVWFSGFTGAIAGYSLLFVVLFLSCVSSLVFCLVTKRLSRKTPFIPFIFISGCLSLVLSFLIPSKIYLGII